QRRRALSLTSRPARAPPRAGAHARVHGRPTRAERRAPHCEQRDGRRADWGFPGTQLRLIAAFIVLFLCLRGELTGSHRKSGATRGTRFAPTTWVPRFHFPTGGVERIGIQLYGAAMLPALPADRNPQVCAKCGVIAGEGATGGRAGRPAGAQLLVAGHFGHEGRHVLGVLAL